jgi:hypothetical protein
MEPARFSCPGPASSHTSSGHRSVSRTFAASHSVGFTASAAEQTDLSHQQNCFAGSCTRISMVRWTAIPPSYRFIPIGNNHRPIPASLHGW